MTDNIAIKVESLGKRYRIGQYVGSGAQYKTLRESLTNAVLAPLRRLRQLGDGRRETSPRSSVLSQPSANRFIWAIQDVSFEVKRGEVLGIIGRNGAGKSTLLKVLTRITEPTKGRVEMHGRVGSLLEVGTGFHPELTGRENIYLSGAILGMMRKEIDRKFDEIVDFSGVEKFIDTPVKRYSSGMRVRLGFAVAAHLEPEILLIDEVLAVGDAEFQKKCLGKMGEVATAGRTVLFVSHNMAAVTQLCSRGILLEQGRVKDIDNADKVVHHYLAAGSKELDTMDLTSYEDRRGTKDVLFEWAQLRNSEQKACQQFSIGDDISVVFGMKSAGEYRDKKVKVAVQIRTSDGIQLCNMVDVDSGFHLREFQDQEALSVCIRDVRFYPGTYYVSLWVGSPTSTETFDRVEDCLSFEIIDGGRLTARSLPRSAGVLFLTPEWSYVSKQGSDYP